MLVHEVAHIANEDLRVMGLADSDSRLTCRRLKGKTRPVVAQEDRALLLSALACVDDVVSFANSLE